MKIERGNPVLDGLYVVYVPGVIGGVSPYIVEWAKDRWRFRGFSKSDYPDKVLAWVGPLPEALPAVEYDL